MADSIVLPLSYSFSQRLAGSNETWSVLSDWSPSNGTTAYFAAGIWQVQANAQDVLGLAALTPAVSNNVEAAAVQLASSTVVSFLDGLQETAPPSVIAGSMSLGVPNPAAAVSSPGFKLGVTKALAKQFGGVPVSWISPTFTASSRLLQRLAERQLAPAVSVGYTVSIPSGSTDFSPSKLLSSFSSATPSGFGDMLNSFLSEAGVSGMSVAVLDLPQPAAQKDQSSTAASLASANQLLAAASAITASLTGNGGNSSVLANPVVANKLLDSLATSQTLSGANMSTDGAKVQVNILSSIVAAGSGNMSAANARKAVAILDTAVSAFLPPVTVAGAPAPVKPLAPKDAQTFVNVATALVAPGDSLVLTGSGATSAGNQSETAAKTAQSQKVAAIVEGIVAAVTKSVLGGSQTCGEAAVATVSAPGLALTAASIPVGEGSALQGAVSSLPVQGLSSSALAMATASAVPNPCGINVGIGGSRWENNPYGPASSLPAGGRRLAQAAMGPVVSLALSSPDGSEVSINDLQLPLQMVIPLAASRYEDVEAMLLTGSHPECRHWNKTAKQWSTAGCRILGLDDSGTLLLCACTHLTPFGNFMGSIDIQSQAADLGNDILKGFLMAFLCANVQIYTTKGFVKLKAMVWRERPSAVVFATLLAAFVLCYILATGWDYYQSHHHKWKYAEAEKATEEEEDLDDLMEDTDRGGEEMSFGQIGHLIKMLCGKLRNLRRTSLLVLYEIIEGLYVRNVTCWRLSIDNRTLSTLLATEVSIEHDKEAQAFIQEALTKKLLRNVEATYMSEMASGQVVREQGQPSMTTAPEISEAQEPDREPDVESPSDKPPELPTALSARSENPSEAAAVSKQMTRASTFKSFKSTTSIKSTMSKKAPADIHGIPFHVASAFLSHLGVNVHDSIESTRAKLRSPSSSCSDKVDEWVAAVLGASNMGVVLASARFMQLAVKICIIAWAAHPLHDILSHSLHAKHAGRAFLLIAAQMMGAACSCLFFSATQGVGADSPPECVPVQGIAATVQTIVVQLVSVLVGVIFATYFRVLEENHRPIRKSRVALVKAVLFYLSAALLFVFFGYTVSSFIANTAEGSTFQWVTALLVGLVHLFFLSPLIGGVQGWLLWPVGSTLLMVIWTLKGLPISYERPKPEGQQEQELNEFVGRSKEADALHRSFREEDLDLPLELVDFYESLETVAAGPSIPKSVPMTPGIPEKALNATEEEQLPEHVVDFLEVIEVMAHTSSRSLSRSRSRSRSDAGTQGRGSRSTSRGSRGSGVEETAFRV